MSHPLLQIADAVAAEINAEFGDALEIAARRILNTELELEDAGVLHVDIVPGSIASEIGTRTSQRGEYVIDIAVRKKLAAELSASEEQAEVDALFAIANDIDKFLFAQQRLSGFPDAAWITSTPRYPYLPAHLRNQRQYTGIVTVTYLYYDE